MPRHRVLHSMRAPGSETRYSNHMAAVESADFSMEFFTWRRALTGHYDLFHLHWPEQLLGREVGVTGWIRWMRVRALIHRLRRRRTPVVYTKHNQRPHDRVPSPRLIRTVQELSALTVAEIHLVSEPGDASTLSIFRIPHGHYREPLASHPRQRAVPGRVLSVGIIKRYKRIDKLVEAFAELKDDDASLRVVGEPSDAHTVAVVERFARIDGRVSSRYGFVSDRELVHEVTSAQLVVLPYAELHSSGIALVALSLDRPVLMPASPLADALRTEVGDGWVHVFSAPISVNALKTALAAPRPVDRPNLDSRAWQRVKEAHTAVYRHALDSYGE